MIKIISKDGKELPSTNRNGKVRILIKEGRARVINKHPYTIQLLYDVQTYNDELEFGHDYDLNQTTSKTNGTRSTYVKVSEELNELLKSDDYESIDMFVEKFISIIPKEELSSSKDIITNKRLLEAAILVLRQKYKDELTLHELHSFILNTNREGSAILNIVQLKLDTNHYLSNEILSACRYIENHFDTFNSCDATLFYLNKLIMYLKEEKLQKVKHKEKSLRDDFVQSDEFLSKIICKESDTGKFGISLSKNIKLNKQKNYLNYLVIGNTGSGKTSSYFIPNILNLDGSQSIVVNDSKGSIYQETKKYLESIGMDIIRLNIVYKNKYFYNPLLIAKNDMELENIAKSIIMNFNKADNKAFGEDRFWIDCFVFIFTSALIYIKEKGNGKTISEAVNLILNSTLSEFSTLLKDIKYFNKIKFSLTENMYEMTKSFLRKSCSIFSENKIKDLTTTRYKTNLYDNTREVDIEKMFHPDMLRRKPTALFISGGSEEDIKMLLSIMYHQLLTSNIDYYRNDDNSTPVFYFLDEFQSIGTILDFDRILVSNRTHKVGISMGLQDIDYIPYLYRDNKFTEIVTNIYSILVYDTNSAKKVFRKLQITDDRNLSKDEMFLILGGKVFVSYKNSYFSSYEYMKKL